ncbi:MAG: Cgl0159 family (beta/alpha)8-fold protein [Acidimicrobiales bacterium]
MAATVRRLILAADHRARGVITIERYADYLDALQAALAFCDGVLATAQPLRDLRLRDDQQTYLSINRTGLAGSAFELDDRLVASVAAASAGGWTGIKHMTRIDLTDPHTAGALELLGRVIEESAAAGLEALIECVPWKDGQMGHDTDAIVHAAVVAHDMGAPLLKVPIPSAPDRVAAIARIVASVGVPVLFLGGPPHDNFLAEVRDVVAGGGAGMAVGRAIFQATDPAGTARQVRDILRA